MKSRVFRLIFKVFKCAISEDLWALCWVYNSWPPSQDVKKVPTYSWNPHLCFFSINSKKYLFSDVFPEGSIITVLFEKFLVTLVVHPDFSSKMHRNIKYHRTNLLFWIFFHPHPPRVAPQTTSLLHSSIDAPGALKGTGSPPHPCSSLCFLCKAVLAEPKLFGSFPEGESYSH